MTDDRIEAELRLVTWNEQGLVPVVVQQWDTLEVLMMAWADEEALRRTLTTGRATYWSRSRQQYWRKGDTSGHVQHVRGARLDCDGDTVLLLVDQIGVACHTGTRTCFDGTDLDPVVTAAQGGSAADDAGQATQ
ncbi:phosphoribosyl-AMP cyclohydrolase [Microbacterium sp. NPDC056052]|uniref:phosphoribosyl-AMP cyclohydrolase n=1 Tax=Microbacterium sp. NPDC056052 TaxID=3345695 RepID=UPI0035DD1050